MTSVPSTKPGLADVGDAAVDDDAGVEDLVAALGTRGAKKLDQARRLEPLAVLGADAPGRDTAATISRKLWRNSTRAVAAVRPRTDRPRWRARSPRPMTHADQRAEDAASAAFRAGGVSKSDDEAGQRRARTAMLASDADGKRLEDGRRVRDGRDERRRARAQTRPSRTPSMTANHNTEHVTAGNAFHRPVIRASSASSASPTVRTPTSSHVRRRAAGSAGSMLASGMMQRANPICAASRTRSGAWVMPRTSPASPTSPNIAVVGGIDAVPDARGDRRQRRRDPTPARRRVIPPAMFTNTSSPIRLRPARFSSTASSSDSRC